jgi:hypothetical protein
MRNRIGDEAYRLTIRFRIGVKCLPGGKPHDPFSADQAFSLQPGAGGEACQTLEPLLAAGGRDRMAVQPEIGVEKDADDPQYGEDDHDKTAFHGMNICTRSAIRWGLRKINQRDVSASCGLPTRRDIILIRRDVAAERPKQNERPALRIDLELEEVDLSGNRTR